MSQNDLSRLAAPVYNLTTTTRLGQTTQQPESMTPSGSNPSIKQKCNNRQPSICSCSSSAFSSYRWLVPAERGDDQSPWIEASQVIVRGPIVSLTAWAPPPRRSRCRRPGRRSCRTCPWTGTCSRPLQSSRRCCHGPCSPGQTLSRTCHPCCRRPASSGPVSRDGVAVAA